MNHGPSSWSILLGHSQMDTPLGGDGQQVNSVKMRCPLCQNVLVIGDTSQQLSENVEDRLTVAQERIRELEAALCDCKQELAAASEIIEEQDWRNEEMKLELEGADMMLEDAAEARRKLEWRMAEAEQAQAAGTPICSLDELDACQITDAVQKARIPAPLPPDGTQHHGATPSRRPNPIVEAMVAQFKARKQ